MSREFTEAEIFYLINSPDDLKTKAKNVKSRSDIIEKFIDAYQAPEPEQKSVDPTKIEEPKLSRVATYASSEEGDRFSQGKTLPRAGDDQCIHKPLGDI